MLTPYWQLDPTDVRRIAWALQHKIAVDDDSGAYLWQGRQHNRYGVTIPAKSGKLSDNLYLRFRAESDTEAYTKGQRRLSILLINSKLSAAHSAAPKESENEATRNTETGD